VIHFPFNNVAADFLDLKPAQVVQALGGPFNCVGDGYFKGFLRGTHDFYFLVYVITHAFFIWDPLGEATLKPKGGFHKAIHVTSVHLNRGFVEPSKGIRD